MARLFLIVSIQAILCLTLGTTQNIPTLDPNEEWGPAELANNKDTSIRPFKIEFTEEIIQDLRFRLRNHRHFTPGLKGANFRYGFKGETLCGWLKYWAEEYPFAERQDLLNQYPQFKTRIQGLDIHFIRFRPEVPEGVEVVPVLMLHGWPGSVREYYEAIPLMTAVSDSRDFAVEVVVPSLPGFGFSDGAVRPGLGVAQCAVILRNLMHRLGHEKFYVVGGDYGYLVNKAMVTLYPEEILGHFTNFPVVTSPAALLIQVLGSFNTSLVVEPAYADRMYPLPKIFAYLMEELGYMHIQATKPDTIGEGLADSPAGLLAYVLEKFSSATMASNRDLPDGGLNGFKPDPLIDNLMMYWVPNSMTTAMRIYSETLNLTQISLGLEQIPSPVPTWALQAKHEIIYQSPIIIRTKFPNLLNTKVLDYGGHFLAMEQPKIFSETALTAIGDFRKWHADPTRESESVPQGGINWSEFFDQVLASQPADAPTTQILQLLIQVAKNFLVTDK